MKRKKKKAEGHTLRLAITFFVLVGLLVAGSLLVKLATVVEKSRFDGAHRFTIEFSEEQSSVKIVSFAPDTRSISILKIQDVSSDFSAGKFLGIPIDAKVKNSKEARLAARQEENVVLQLQSLLFSYGKAETTLTPIDILRLWLFAKGVPSSSFAFQEISSTLAQASIDRISSSLFLDYSLSQENVSVQIVNGTGVLGLGNRLARLITNMGGNVVSVETSDDLIKQSKITYQTKKTYALEKLVRVLGFPSSFLEEKGIADIVLTLGEDSIPKVLALF